MHTTCQGSAIHCSDFLNSNPFPSSGAHKLVQSARVTSDRSRTDGVSPKCRAKCATSRYKARRHSVTVLSQFGSYSH